MMASFGKIAVVSGALAAATAAVVMQGPSTAPATGQPGSSLIICAGADAVLRAADAAGGCAAGDQEVPLDSPDTAKRGADPLADLERRIADLEQYTLFQVVDNQANLIFAVAPGLIRMYSQSGSSNIPVAVVRATDDGGWFTASSTDESLEASFGVSLARSGVWISENGVERVQMGRRPAGTYALRFLSGADAVGAAVGQSAGGPGAIHVATQAGDVKAAMSVSAALGELSVASARDGQTVALLKQSVAGPGLLTLADATSNPMVKMAVTDRYGAVLAGPAAGAPLIQSSGIPGSYFFGCSAGEACRPY